MDAACPNLRACQQPAPAKRPSGASSEPLAISPAKPWRASRPRFRGSAPFRQRTAPGSLSSRRPGIGAFVAWSRRPDAARAITAEVFGSAPRELARAVSLQQTVELVRTTIEVVEEHSAELAAPGDESQLREAVLVFAREVAFAAAEVYAQAAEVRGAWDARLEALLADALIRGEVGDDDISRAAALGWSRGPHVFAIAGLTPDATAAAVVDAVRRAARAVHLDVVSGVHGHELVCVLGGKLSDPPDPPDPVHAVQHLVSQFGSGQVVVGPVVSDLAQATTSVAAALAGLRAAAGWPHAPRPVSADALLPERALDGDVEARRSLVERVDRPLADAGGGRPTRPQPCSNKLSRSRPPPVPCTRTEHVRYRLRRISEVSGLVPTEPRDAFTLRVALTVGRLDERTSPPL